MIRNQSINDSSRKLDLMTPFAVNKLLFEYCFNLSKTQASIILRETWQVVNPKPCEPVAFEKLIMATISYLMHGNFICLLEEHPAFFIYSIKDLEKNIPIACDYLTTGLANYYKRCNLIPRVINERKIGFGKLGLPNVVGIMDSFTMCVQEIHNCETPVLERFHDPFCIYVQAVCDEKLRFIDLDASHAGENVHIIAWKNSIMQHTMKRINIKEAANSNSALLIMRHEYPNESFLMRKENMLPNKCRVNAVNKITRTAIFHLRSRFNCLNSELTLTHSYCIAVVNACATLHNLIIDKGWEL